MLQVLSLFVRNLSWKKSNRLKQKQKAHKRITDNFQFGELIKSLQKLKGALLYTVRCSALRAELGSPSGRAKGAACSCAICHNSIKKRSASAPIRSVNCLTKGPACEQAGPFCGAAALRRIRERRNPARNPIVGEIAGQSLSQQKQKPAYPRGHAGFCWRRKRDLNPRAGYPTYALSRGASSTS